MKQSRGNVTPSASGRRSDGSPMAGWEPGWPPRVTAPGWGTAPSHRCPWYRRAAGAARLSPPSASGLAVRQRSPPLLSRATEKVRVDVTVWKHPDAQNFPKLSARLSGDHNLSSKSALGALKAKYIYETIQSIKGIMKSIVSWTKANQLYWKSLTKLLFPVDDHTPPHGQLSCFLSAPEPPQNF